MQATICEVRTMNRALQQHKADFFKSMASPMRLAMLEMLAEKESTVKVLADAVGLDVSTASRHLSQLRAAGVIDATHEGATLVYRLADDRVAELLRVARAIIAKRLHMNSELLADLGSPAGE
jgi:DNA-binding transcriptional ArsR family regulator